MKRNSLIIVALGLLTAGAYAATTGTITIEGKVDPSASIQITSEVGFNTLDLAINATDKKVATANEKCNKLDGYTVTLESANAKADSGSQAFLKGNLVGNTETVNYTIKYGGAAVALANGSATVTPNGTKTGGLGVNKEIAISYTGDSGLAADTYKDTLTLTIALK